MTPTHLKAKEPTAQTDEQVLHFEEVSVYISKLVTLEVL